MNTDLMRPPTSLTELGTQANSYAAHDAFTEYRSRLDPATLNRHSYDLGLWCVYLEDAGVSLTVEDLLTTPQQWAGTTHGLIRGFVKWMLLDGFAIGTVNVRLSTVRSYAKLAAIAGFLAPTELALIEQIKGYGYQTGQNVDAQRAISRKGAKKARPVLITAEQRIQLKRQHPDTPQGRRDALLMCLLLDHGLRCGEVADLLAHDVSLSTGTMTLTREKSKLTQTHMLSADTLLALLRYQEVATPDGPLLVGSRKGHDGQHLEGTMSRRAITKRVCMLSKRILGLVGFSAHDCRHAWVEAAIRGKTDIKALQDAGGWGSPVMPLRYAAAADIANSNVTLA